MDLVKCFASIQHAIYPGQQLFGGMVSVQDDAGAVQGSNLMHMMCARNCPSNGRFLAIIVHRFAGKKDGTAIRKLQNNGGIDVTGRF